MANSEDNGVLARIGDRPNITGKGEHGPSVVDSAELSVRRVVQYTFGDKGRAQGTIGSGRISEVANLPALN